MTMTELKVVLTQTVDRRPLATVENLPGSNADMTPSNMRALAAALCAVATECEAQPMDKRRFIRAVRRYQLSSTPGHRPA